MEGSNGDLTPSMDPGVFSGPALLPPSTLTVRVPSPSVFQRNTWHHCLIQVKVPPVVH